ncbi:hypothetical protein OsI_19710 [Oryza sativa Indica Group]|uniref:Myb-like domain-containing protein n=1 Tax=Oryza sativa subsp. indica TaxID=39946 RepID=A2Y3Y0_ORYSI|nr:hypothetical protein OsI_19710 [Oryza sativa Indica Group]
MDSSNQKFIDLLSQDSPNHAEKTSHNSPPQQFPNNFPQSQFTQSFNPHFLHNFYPFSSPSNYPPYGHSPPSFQGTPPSFQGIPHQGNWAQPNLATLQGFHLQENMVHSPNQGFGTANHQAIFALQYPLVRATVNSSSHGSESSTPCPARQQEAPVNLESSSESSEDEVRRATRTNWTEEENLRLISAWLSNSVDPIDGNDKKGEYYWKDVADEFNNNRPTNGHKRTVKQLKTHWGNVKKDIGKFCGVYAQVRRTCTSGHSDDMIMEKAHLWYKNQSNQKKPFTLEYM